MNPSQVRARVLAEHLWLRQKIDRLEGSAERCIYGMPGELRRLQSAVQELVAALELHLSTEDEILLPVLRDLDAWGELRAERVRQEHQAQRQELRELERMTRTAAQEELANAALAFCRALRQDMAGEERVTLSPDVLRDDVVTVDQLDA